MGGAVRLEKVANVAIKKAEIFHQLINMDIHSSYGAKLKIQKAPRAHPRTPTSGPRLCMRLLYASIAHFKNK